MIFPRDNFSVFYWLQIIKFHKNLKIVLISFLFIAMSNVKGAKYKNNFGMKIYD